MSSFSAAGRSLLRQLEGLRLAAYDDATGWPPAPGEAVLGRMTIGYGHTGPEVVPGLVWSTDQAERQLDTDVGGVSDPLSAMLNVDLTDNQFSALVCLAFNIGVGAVAGSSALKLANQRAFDAVPAHIALWDKVTEAGTLEVSPGLVGRRAAEIALWMLPDPAPIPDFTQIRDAAVAAFRLQSAGRA